MKILALLLSALLMVSLSFPASGIERYTFQLMFSSVGVDEELLAKDYHAAMRVLEARALDPEGEYIDGELSTLCALYVLTKQLASAHNACDTAVADEDSHTAYNNRGVLRVKMKNTTAALEDFVRARVPPAKKQIYIQELMKLDVRLVADENYTEAARYMDAHRPPTPSQALSERMNSADVEDMNQ